MTKLQYDIPANLGTLTQHLFDIASSPEKRHLHQEITPEAHAALLQKGLDNAGQPFQEVLDELLHQVMPNAMTMAHPRCFAFIPSAPHPMAWMIDAIVSAYNPFSGSWLQSSGPTSVELATIDLLRRQVGLPDTAGGVFLSGGSMANMTGLATARSTKLAQEHWKQAVAYITSQAHSSIAKGLRFIGVPDQNIRVVKVNECGQMNTSHLLALLKTDLHQGLSPFVVAATFGTTNIGTIDPIDEIAKICQEYNLWLHVDGAYGASIAFSKTHKHQAAVLKHADSLSWDPHKWLFQTYVCSCLLVKNRQHLPDSLSTQPDYLRDAETESNKPNYWDFGPEMTRPARAVRLWAVLQHLGRDALAKAIDHNIQLAELAADSLSKLNSWRITSDAQMSILCFRFEPDGFEQDQVDLLNAQISKQVFEQGLAAVFTTRLHDQTNLRICTTNPNTTEQDILETIKILNDTAINILTNTKQFSTQDFANQSN